MRQLTLGFVKQKAKAVALERGGGEVGRGVDGADDCRPHSKTGTTGKEQR